jgi:hypothetical protein
MRFDLTTLNLVLAIADTRSITRGAERESLALAAASKRLSDLEARLGVSAVRPPRTRRRAHRGRAARCCATSAAERVAARAGKRSRRVLARHQGPPARGGQCQRHRRTPAGRPGGVFATGAPRHPRQPGRADQRRRAGRRGRRPRRCGHLHRPAGRAVAETRPYREGELAILVPRGHVLARRKGGTAFDALLDFDIVGLHAGAAAHEQMLQRAQALGRPLKAPHAGARLRRHRAAGRSRPGRGRAAGRGGAPFCQVFRVQPLVLQETGRTASTCWPCAGRPCCRRRCSALSTP